MKRNAFTLVELIFVIVIIGVLAAIAVPQFRQLQENAQIANIVKYYSDILTSAKSSYLNEVELNNVTPAALNLTQLYDFRGRGWVISNNNDTATYTVSIGGADQTLAVVYDNAGVITMTTTIAGAQAQRIMDKLADKTSMTFTAADVNQTILNLTN
ncbi:prepilin-type N-terminal cleavage/methylation domain-containing protein [Sulfuricurvum sp.]|uniref:type IV pilin protein n=1 Tax=Sulfuricurvum sp. TaxID=2025608 RepID=UPI00262B9D35|nr:prepilin-type N-terminal cleavage/methylation domain-containing protein [Sulfuricurvum sp.]MDD4882835.1 prepilin-type N-terminal cleavage/methylation domain-containing protein [Sulfuricurvum sp.]